MEADACQVTCRSVRRASLVLRPRSHSKERCVQRRRLTTFAIARINAQLYPLHFVSLVLRSSLRSGARLPRAAINILGD